MKINVGIIGASGYTGAELMRLLALHPNFTLKAATADSQAGKQVHHLYPSLGSNSLTLRKLEDAMSALSECEVIFCALPHGEAMSTLGKLSNRLIIDLGSDFRLPYKELYTEWYKREHTAPSELGKWAYGLTELFRSEISPSSRIANPGCYATAVIAALAPLYRADLVEPIAVVDAVSGISGAGRNPGPAYHLPHAYEDVRSYKVASHQHTPEMEMGVEKFSAKKVTISFTPHLVPMSRGIHATCSAPLRTSATFKGVIEALRDTYSNEPFIHVCDQPPGTKEVRGSNSIRISPVIDARSGRVIVTSVLDNLVKGAAGQAIQNANLALGLDERTGLPVEGVYP
ncbi:MAG: N-acetyl-gamma-glutamyl-phosphate reductase [Deltaproteobacteria bacterium]|nr:N-acetyl-gamma-glutamyl-phosphate reductase [Deltaproteobacteria bacterium]